MPLVPILLLFITTIFSSGVNDCVITPVRVMPWLILFLCRCSLTSCDLSLCPAQIHPRGVSVSELAIMYRRAKLKRYLDAWYGHVRERKLLVSANTLYRGQ